MNTLLPPVWLIVIIAGLPLFSETVYTPSLPNIALTLQTSASMVEYTLTIYLLGFALGTLAWGKFSDKFGRKPGILLGLCLFTLGCLGCYFSESVEFLMFSRFIQAFGGSIGSVLGQAVCRDAFHGSALGQVYVLVSSALSIFPAIGPVIGGVIAENFGWRNIFILLLVIAIALIFLIKYRLPETHLAENRTSVSLLDVALNLLKNKRVLGFALLVGGCNGISFSYYAEGPFYLIKTLDLSPSQYGITFIALAASTMLGGVFSKKLHRTQEPLTIICYGLTILLLATTFHSIVLFSHMYFFALPNLVLIAITLVTLMSIMFAICMVTSNALALALVDYKWCIGTASSLFGFFYYGMISLLTFGMGYLHNGSLLVMPFYFLAISLIMYLVYHWIFKAKN